MSLKKVINYSVITTLVILGGCSTNIKVKYLKPAEVNLGTKRKLAVLNFNINGSLKDFYNRNTTLLNSNSLSNEIVQHLIDDKYYTVVERNELSKVMAEQALSASGFVDKDKVLELGKLSGAEVLITGSGSYSVDESMSKTYDKKEYTNRTVKYQNASLKRALTLRLNYRIIDTQTGEIITSRNISKSSEDSVYPFPLEGTQVTEYNQSSDPFANAPTTSTGTKEQEITFYSIYDKMGQLDSWQTLLSRTENNASYDLVYDITPHYIEEDREVKDGNSQGMKQAVELIKKGDWENAKYLWESVIKDPTLTNDYVNAMNNLGLYYEVNGNFDNSILYFEQAYKYSNDEMYLNKKQRILKRKAEIAVLNEQGLTDTNIKTKKISADQQVDVIDHYQLGVKYQSAGNIQEALSEFKKALDQKPDDLSVNSSLAGVCYALGKYDDAINYYTKITTLTPAEPTSYFNLGLAYHSSGKINQAKDIYLKSCQMGFKTACDTLLSIK